MFRSLRDIAGILVLLLAVVVLAALVVNSSVSAKDIKNGAGDFAKRAEGEIGDIFREKIKAEPNAEGSNAPPEPKPNIDPGALDPVTKALAEDSKPKKVVAKPDSEEIDEIDRLLEKIRKETNQAKKKEAPAPKKTAELTRPANVSPEKAPAKPAEALRRRGVTNPGRRADTTREAVYMIQRGDTLYGIAASHYGDGKLWKLVAKANGITDPSKIPVGRKLRLPPKP